MNYLITTNYYPENDYDVGNGQYIKIVKNPYYDFEETKSKSLNVLNGQIWEYSLSIPDSYQNRNDLILFLSFISNNNQTYHYAENANKLLFEDDELEFIEDRSLIKKSGGFVMIVDFNRFPLLMTCNQIPESEMKFENVDFKTSFKKFLKLKEERVKGLTSKYNLYDLICLYNFSRNFETTHKLYRNSNLPLSFYITILESLIGKPENCRTKVHCDTCNSDVPHSKISLEKHFEKYFGKFKKIRKIRHEIFHGGSFFDFKKYFGDTFKGGVNWISDEKNMLYHHKREEMECVIRILLTTEFYHFFLAGSDL